MIEQVFIPTSELQIPTGKTTTKVNAKTETQPATVEAKISKNST